MAKACSHASRTSLTAHTPPRSTVIHCGSAKPLLHRVAMSPSTAEEAGQAPLSTLEAVAVLRRARLTPAALMRATGAVFTPATGVETSGVGGELGAGSKLEAGSDRDAAVDGVPAAGAVGIGEPANPVGASRSSGLSFSLPAATADSPAGAPRWRLTTTPPTAPPSTSAPTTTGTAHSRRRAGTLGPSGRSALRRSPAVRSASGRSALRRQGSPDVSC